MVDPVTEDPAPSEVLLEYTQDVVVVLDADGRVTYANRAAERFGYDPEALLGRDAFALIHPADRATVEERFGSLVDAEETRRDRVTYRLATADGDWVWMESHMANVHVEELDGYVVSSRDVTDRIRAERERRATKARLEEIAATTNDVLWTFTADWEELLFVNGAYEDVFGRSVAELRADPGAFLDAVHPEDVPRVRNAMERISGGESVDVDYRVDAGADYWRWVWVRGEPVIEDGEVVRVVGFTRDVTERRRRERHLDVVDQLLRHTLQNDMNVVLGYAERIAELGDDEAAEYAGAIRAVVEELLSSAGKQREIVGLLTSPAAVETIDLAAVVRNAVETFRDGYPAATVETDLPESAHVVALPAIQRAVEELIGNAIRHDDSGEPALEIELVVGGDGVVLEVADDCAPIPESEYLVLTGERDMTEVYHGTGLGLWLVYWAVDLSAGRVAFDTREDGGNVVTVTLPRASA